MTALLAVMASTHQQNVRGAHGLFDAVELVHQLLVNLQAAGGIDDDIVVAVVLGVAHSLLGGEHRSWVPRSNTGAPAFSPTTCSCLIAAGR